MHANNVYVQIRGGHGAFEIGFLQRRWLILSVMALAPASTCFATYHFMQIEQVVAGVNGDTLAQAIQLRMRSASQNHVDHAKLIAFDAAGENPVVIIDFGTDVTQEAAGSRVLVVSSAMTAYTDPPVQPDFVMTNPIPESYLAAGSLLFENDEETLLVWRFSWGGDAYTGPTTAALTNDEDGEFAPPFAGSLPTTGLQALQFGGASSDKSQSNAADYTVTSDAAELTNNAGDSFTLVVPDCTDSNGAGPDTDGDGVRDVCDGCPTDTDKIESGVCGCGEVDTDADGNGLIDCVEDAGSGTGGTGTDGDSSGGTGGSTEPPTGDGSQGGTDGTDSGANDGATGTGADGSGGGSAGSGAGNGSGTIPRPCSFGTGTLLSLVSILTVFRLHPIRRRLVPGMMRR